MANGETARARSPRGTKQVATAFFVALGDIPDTQRASVAKAALMTIRDTLKAQREKAKGAAARARTKAAATKVASPKVASPRARAQAMAAADAAEKPAVGTGSKPGRKPRAAAVAA